MTLSSMTGWAEVAGGANAFAWRWEARSVNARGLDLRLRLPEGWEGIEPELRRRAAVTLARGAVSLSLKVERAAGEGPAIDHAVLRAALAALKEVAEAATSSGVALSPAAPERLLALRGVMAETAAAPGEDVRAAALADAEALLDRLADSRATEGAALGSTMAAALEEIAVRVREARAAHERQIGATSERLQARVASLLGAGAEAPPDRLAAELALLAVKSDVTEELDRLDAHVAAAGRLLTKGGAVGRELDFLAQEFAREANTLCAKSESMALTEAGLAIKVLVDRIREQAQNLQ